MIIYVNMMNKKVGALYQNNTINHDSHCDFIDSDMSSTLKADNQEMKVYKKY